MRRLNSNAVSPVIALILLLAVTIIIGVLTYQFLISYSQEQLLQTQNNLILDDFNIRVINSNAQESIIQTPFPELNVTRVLLDGTECEGNIGILLGSPLRINLSSCSQNITVTRPRLIIETEDGIIQRDLSNRNLGVSISSSSSQDSSSGFSLDCSSLDGEWVQVSENSQLGTSDFCIMKYHAKDVGGTPRSQASELPWTNINQFDTRSACESLGEGFRLPTDREWVAMAREVENRAENWVDGQVGSIFADGGGLFQGIANEGSGTQNACSGGYSDALSSSPDCFLTNSHHDNRNKRVFFLNSGEEIWDISGNVWDWTNDTKPEGTVGIGSWLEFTSVSSSFDYLKPSDSSFNSSHRVGAILSNSEDSSRGIFRGAQANEWNIEEVGIFSVSFLAFPSGSGSFGGFRCVYN